MNRYMLTIRVERNTLYPVGTSDKRRNHLSSCHIPDTHKTIRCPGGDVFTIWRKCYAALLSLMLIKSPYKLPVEHIPQQCIQVTRAGDNHTTIWGKCYSRY